jgi:WD40 repeat protein
MEGPLSALRLLNSQAEASGHSGEVFTCAYTPDGSTLLTGGWDGEVRLWETTAGAALGSIRASTRPISACAVAPQGDHFMTGCMDGFLTCWDSFKRQQLSSFVAHGRPISVIAVDPSSQLIATGSWDGCINILDSLQSSKARSFVGHSDVVAGCKFTADGKTLLSWSYDGSMCLWDVDWCRNVGQFARQDDRVTAGALSPDGRLAASGTRSGIIKLWNLRSKQEICSLKVANEIRGCFFLLDGESLLVVDSMGSVTLHALPELGLHSELSTNLPVICAELSPAGNQVALGCQDGQVRFVTVEQFDSLPLIVTAKRSTRRTATPLQRLFGRSRLVFAYRCTCPVCRREIEMPQADPSQTLPCPSCSRLLRVGDILLPTLSTKAARAELPVVAKSESWK